MADEIDRANEQAQAQLDASLASSRTVNRPKAQGFCLAPRCGEEFNNQQDAQRLFCNAACANDYERHHQAK